MPISYKILSGHNLMVVHYDGEITLSDISQWRQTILSDPAFRPSLCQLVDLRAARLKNFSVPDVRSVSSPSILNPGVRRAILAITDNEFGLARMFGVFAESHGQNVQVFRSVVEACEWLGVPVEVLPDKESGE